MDKKNLPLILIVAVFALVFSVVLSKFFITTQSDKKLTAEVVQPISTEFLQPDKNVFNEKAINPTQLIQIGGTNNSKPF